ncbi:MAG: ATP-dependent helicase [Campylobacteraceae bacterium]|nr:ATP-dependent helicase [Campylobacteraceae bacterium]
MPLSRLNQEQFAAATAPFGHNLVIASAGTGKTSTIVARIAHLLQKGVRAEEILLLTFTNKAASEMIERVARYFDNETVKKIESGTFHAISYKLLKRIGKNISLKQPRELKILLKAIHAKRRFSHIDSPVKPYQASYLYDLFSLYQNSEVHLSFSEWLKNNESEHSVYFDIYEDILEEFQSEKRAFSYVDFNDLLIFLRNELKGDTGLFFKEILIDEYQDTNTLQGSLIKAFKCDSVFCVGDYDQSIYAFNGANIKIIGTFKERYADANIFTLDKNYRSSQMILSLANRVIEKNPRLYPKELKVTREGTFDDPKLLIYSELFEQYQGVAAKIQASKTPPHDIAVIFRNNSSADGIEASLRELGIKCKRKGSSSFFDSMEVKAMLDLMSLFINPKDMMAFIHIFEYAKGVGAAFSKELFDALLEIGDGDIKEAFFKPKDVENPFKKKVKNTQLGLFDDIHDNIGSVGRFYHLGFDESFLSNPILKNSRINEETAKFIHHFYKFLKESRTIKLPLSLCEHAMNSRVFEEITNLLAKKRGTLKDGNIDEKLVGEAKERIMRKAWLLKDLSKNYRDIPSFLNALTLGSSEMSEGEGINLLSIHASKGLEFKEVYVVDLMDGRFPNRKLMSMGGSLEEERRLFYVAATRAKDRLFLSYAKYDRIKKTEYVMSQFLNEAGFSS